MCCVSAVYAVTDWEVAIPLLVRNLLAGFLVVLETSLSLKDRSIIIMITSFIARVAVIIAMYRYDHSTLFLIPLHHQKIHYLHSERN